MRRIFRSGEWAAKLPSAGIALKWADILFVGVNSTHNLHAPARRHSDRRRAEVHQPPPRRPGAQRDHESADLVWL